MWGGGGGGGIHSAVKATMKRAKNHFSPPKKNTLN